MLTLPKPSRGRLRPQGEEEEGMMAPLLVGSSVSEHGFAKLGKVSAFQTPGRLALQVNHVRNLGASMKVSNETPLH